MQFPHISDRATATLYMLTGALLFGAAAPFAKLLGTAIAPVTLSAFVYLGSGIVLSGYYAFARRFGRRDQHQAPFERSDIPYVTGSILTGAVIATIVLMVSLQHTPATTASLLLGFEAVATTLIAAGLFHEAVGRRVWVALTLITGACVLLAYEPEGAFGISLGALGVIAATFCWGLDTNLSRHFSGKDPVRYVSIKGLSGGMIMLVLAVLLGQPMPPTAGLALAAMGVGLMGFGGLMTICFLVALRSLGASRSAAFFSMNPFFGVFVAFIIFQEMPGPLFYAAFAVMVLGAGLLITETHSHQHRHERLVHDHRHRHDDPHHTTEAGHVHGPEIPPLGKGGYHAHRHIHNEMAHEHSHVPDLHHRHGHGKKVEK
ncbi:MAG TPA: DMT family transporter [Methanoculleus sp.]|nr:DMT family transporter [Methanoculleus sp.]